MITYTVDELKVILAEHRKWFYGEEGGKRADLQGADLQDANMKLNGWFINTMLFSVAAWLWVAVLVKMIWGF